MPSPLLPPFGTPLAMPIQHPPTPPITPETRNFSTADASSGNVRANSKIVFGFTADEQGGFLLFPDNIPEDAVALHVIATITCRSDIMVFSMPWFFPGWGYTRTAARLQVVHGSVSDPGSVRMNQVEQTIDEQHLILPNNRVTDRSLTLDCTLDLGTPPGSSTALDRLWTIRTMLIAHVDGFAAEAHADIRATVNRVDYEILWPG